MERPHCWPEGHACPNNCAAALHDRLIENTTPLYGQWAGWRMAGQCLVDVSPNGDRIAPERLRGTLFTKAARERLVRTRREQRPLESSNIFNLVAAGNDHRGRPLHTPHAGNRDCRAARADSNDDRRGDEH